MSQKVHQPLVIAPEITTALDTSVRAFNQPLASYLDSLGLPTENVLMPIEERRLVIDSLAGAISALPLSERQKAHYLSKYTVAVCTGLFDAALNYLWDETVQALRRLVVRTDLSYFFDVVEKREEHRKRLRDEEDLVALGEATLIEGCSRVGILSTVNAERLRHINYMRNHASAAHPNQADLNGPEMVGWLANCLRYAITAEPNHEAMHLQRLLHSVRNEQIPSGDLAVIVEGALRLPQERIDDLLWTLFGLYCDPKQTTTCRSNIEALAPRIWSGVSENRRHEIGARHADFTRHAELQKKELASAFLVAVDGLQYRSDDVLAAELLDKLDLLVETPSAGMAPRHSTGGMPRGAG